jgi:hypothetical protein
VAMTRVGLVGGDTVLGAEQVLGERIFSGRAKHASGVLLVNRVEPVRSCTRQGRPGTSPGSRRISGHGGWRAERRHLSRRGGNGTPAQGPTLGDGPLRLERTDQRLAMGRPGPDRLPRPGASSSSGPSGMGTRSLVTEGELRLAGLTVGPAAYASPRSAASRRGGALGGVAASQSSRSICSRVGRRTGGNPQDSPSSSREAGAR